MEMDPFSERTRLIAAWALFGLALAYAFVAGLRTVADFDVGWLLATGRYLVSHHAVPRTEVLSYTAYGVPWIYPPFGGALLYLAYAVGGFAALSWINAVACAAVIAVAVGRPRLLTCALAILAVPSIAFRTAPRAELFTTFFFAAYLALLWKHPPERKEEGNEKRFLWLLPLIMLVWVNVHPGFVVGLVLLGVYVAQELLESCSASRRPDAKARLKSAAPWIVLSMLATLVNPWGVKVYAGLLAQNKVAQLHSALIGEWSGVRLTAASFAGAFQLRDPNSSYWWLLVFACFAAAMALYRRQFANALLLAGAAYLSVEHLRFQALFAIAVIVIAGEVFSHPLPSPFSLDRTTVRNIAPAAAAVIIAALALLHIADTIDNRSYLANGELSSFGAGLSWWYPQGAAQFIESNALPGQLFNDYNSGGYLTLRLGPQYRDFADGRALPFALEVLTLQSRLVESPPDSALWTQEADRYGINTILLSLARSGGLESVPLKQYCESSEWKPVYLDDVSIVLVRNRPENQPWIERFAMDCASDRIAPSRANLSPANSSSPRERAELYNFYANTASIYYVLGRDHDALNAIAGAESLFTNDPSLPLLTGQLLQANGKLAEAEAQYRSALRIRQTDIGWYLLARLLLAQKNYPEAAAALRRSADLAVSPADRYRVLGEVDLAMNKPEDALSAFDSAERFGKKLAPLPGFASLSAKLAEGRGRAWLALHDATRATAFLEQSTGLAPEPRRWNLLADCYIAQGRTAEAEQARNRARELSAANQKSAHTSPPSGLSPPTPASAR
jgi:tetratricopeptide (TPR) repeat protein